MASTRPLSVLSRSLSLRLLKKPPVWYCPRIFPLFDRSQSRAFPDFKRRPNFLPLPLLPLRRSRSMMFAHLCLGGTSYTLLSWLPTYFKETFPHSKVVLSSDDEIQPRKTSHAALVPARAAGLCTSRELQHSSWTCLSPNLSVLAGMGVQRNTVVVRDTLGSRRRLRFRFPH